MCHCEVWDLGAVVFIAFSNDLDGIGDMRDDPIGSFSGFHCQV